MNVIDALMRVGPSAALEADMNEFFNIVPELKLLVGLHQGGRHEFDAWNHTLTVVDTIRPDPVLRMAALLHDVAKPQCCTCHPKVPGAMQFIGHAKAGMPIAESICQRLGMGEEMTDRVVGLVGLHMNPIMLVANGCSAKGVRNLRKDAGLLLTDLLELSHADLTGTGNGRDAESELKPIHDALAAMI